MAIKNRDGKVFRLSGPNPVMAEQEIWTNEEKLLVHNKLGTKIVFNKNLNPIIEKVVEEMGFFEKKPVQTIIAIPSVEAKTIDKLPPHVSEEEVDQYKIKMWCYPAYIEQKRDPLYGEIVKRTKYGEKFLCEAIIDDQSDFSLVVWVTTDKITENSVIFPKNFDKRWWRVFQIHESEDTPGLYQLVASVTDFHPSF